ncbi:hypothetical protein J1TS1_02350 [Shouchella clausii]|uniref:SA1320 family protein n=1 Tax=Shouchella clausii TaxID=79880 RepID=UPI000799A914|nr:hypothetical protein [Shouchella clausii]KKI86204.1 hypothetical protein WZ76_12575 [Shouchella clausii]GIN06090.1 hypothetical protein J1TS1_02350 [Shouchella clausii]
MNGENERGKLAELGQEDMGGDKRQVLIVGSQEEGGYEASSLDTSLMTEKPLYSGGAQQIELDYGSVAQLGNLLERTVQERLLLVRTHINDAKDITEQESARFLERVNQLREMYVTLVEQAGEGGLFQGIGQASGRLTQAISGVQQLISDAERCCRGLREAQTNAPEELAGSVSQQAVQMEDIFAEIRHLVSRLEEGADQLFLFVNHVSMNYIEDVFRGGQDLFADSVVEEFRAHLDYIVRNEQQVYQQIADYKEQVVFLAQAFTEQDQTRALADQSSASGAVNLATQGTSYPLEDSPYMLSAMDIREFHATNGIERLSTATVPLLFNILEETVVAVKKLELLGEEAVAAVQEASHVPLYGTLSVSGESLFASYRASIEEKALEAMSLLREANTQVAGIRQGLYSLQWNYPSLLEELRPQIEEVLFNGMAFQSVHACHSAASDLLNEMQIAFKDVVFQLAQNQAQSIEELHNSSHMIVENMELLKSQMKRGTIG